MFQATGEQPSSGTDRGWPNAKTRVNFPQQSCDDQAQDRVPQVFQPTSRVQARNPLVSVQEEGTHDSLSGLGSSGMSSKTCVGRAKKLRCVNTWRRSASERISGSGGIPSGNSGLREFRRSITSALPVSFVDVASSPQRHTPVGNVRSSRQADTTGREPSAPAGTRFSVCDMDVLGGRCHALASLVYV